MAYIGDILPEDPDGEFDPEVDTLELIADDQPGGGDTFSLEAAEAVVVYVIPWKKARSFIRFMLGFSYADEGAPFKLYRENPQVHPRFPMLTASTIHFAAAAPLANAFDGVPLGAPNFPAILGGFDDTQLTKTSLYQVCYATVRFVQRPWAFLPDNTVTTHRDELLRNTYATVTSSVEMLSAEGPLGQMRWQTTGEDGPSATAPDNLINTPFGTLVGKTMFNLRWMWVPENYVSSDPLLFSPERIISCIANVNSVKFHRWGPGTVMLMPPQYERFQWPISTTTGLYPFFGLNITLPIVHFKPRPRGVDAAREADELLDGDPTNAAYLASAESYPDGYRLLPWPRNRRWFPAVRDDGESYLYAETDLYNIFRHISEPI
jgi:hypothetical protein